MTLMVQEHEGFPPYCAPKCALWRAWITKSASAFPLPIALVSGSTLGLPRHYGEAAKVPPSFDINPIRISIWWCGRSYEITVLVIKNKGRDWPLLG